MTDSDKLPVLIYFDAFGRAEVIRLVLAAAGVKYEDKRVTFDEWKELKKEIPSGKLPHLITAEGYHMEQSLAIARFYASANGLRPLDKLYAVERAVEEITDIVQELGKIMYGPEDQREPTKKEFIESKGKKHLHNLIRFLEEGKGKFLAGDRVTLADLHYISLHTHIETFFDFQGEFAKLAHLVKDVIADQPGVAHWLEVRPKTRS